MRLKSYLAAMLFLLMIAFPSYLLIKMREPVYAFRDVNLITMTSEIVSDHQTVLISGSTITAIGPNDQIRVPRGAMIINGNGFYLLPGLADMHMHTRQDWDERTIWPVQPLNLYLANGVTMIRDMGPEGGDLAYSLGWGEEIRDGSRDGPTIITSGKIIYSSAMGDAEGLVVENFTKGFDFLKIYSYPSADDAERALQKSEELGFYSSGHIPFSLGLKTSLELGLDEVAHVEELIYELFDFDRDQNLPPGDWMGVVRRAIIEEYLSEPKNFSERFLLDRKTTLNEIAELLVAYNIPVSTTMVVDDVVVMKINNPEEFLNRPENVYFEEGYLQHFLAGDEKHLNQCKGYEEICTAKAEVDLEILQVLHQHGVTLLLGTDSGTGGMGIIPGFSVHDELDLLMLNGFTNFEALQTCTLNAARVAKRITGQGNFGTIEVGNRADLILVENDPLKDLSALRSPAGVMAAGRWYDRVALREMLEIK